MKVCLLLSDLNQSAWFADSIKTMMNETSAEINLIATPERDSSANNTRTKNIVELLPDGLRDNIPILVKKIYAWTFFARMRPLMVMTPKLEKKYENKSIKNIDGLSNPTVLTFDPIEENNRVCIPEKTVSTISERCDLIIHRGVGILSGDILTATKFGVLSFHHGDIRKYRGVPAGFWEFMHGRSSAGVTLQQITEELDNGKIVEFEEVDISDAKSWSDILYNQCDISEIMLANAISDLLTPGYEPKTPEKTGDLYLKSDVEGWGIKIQYLKKVLSKSIK